MARRREAGGGRKGEEVRKGVEPGTTYETIILFILRINLNNVYCFKEERSEKRSRQDQAPRDIKQTVSWFVLSMASRCMRRWLYE
jgi:hypothetical protein